MSDPGTSYRTREEIKKMKESSDPIQGLKLRAIETGLMTEEDCKVHSCPATLHLIRGILHCIADQCTTLL